MQGPPTGRQIWAKTIPISGSLLSRQVFSRPVLSRGALRILLQQPQHEQVTFPWWCGGQIKVAAPQARARQCKVRFLL